MLRKEMKSRDKTRETRDVKDTKTLIVKVPDNAVVGTPSNTSYFPSLFSAKGNNPTHLNKSNQLNKHNQPSKHNTANLVKLTTPKKIERVERIKPQTANIAKIDLKTEPITPSKKENLKLVDSVEKLISPKVENIVAITGHNTIRSALRTYSSTRSSSISSKEIK